MMSKGVRQISGLNNATRVAHKNHEDEQSVIIRDEPGMVTLNLRGCDFPAGMTPEQARYVAKCLVDAADRVEGQGAE